MSKVEYFDKESVPWKFVGLRMYRMHFDGVREMHNGDLAARVRHQGRIITEEEERSLAAMMPRLNKAH